MRLEEARKHKTISNNILAEIHKDTDKDVKRDLKQQAKAENKEYSSLKKARWTLLMNSNKLSDNGSEYLKEILNNHHALATCYAMKEEMCELFALTDATIAEKKWHAWFTAAKSSEIPALVKFATLKEKRIPGLVAHAEHQISTGKLEGFNNKIKVAKRIGYGYRDEDFFFSLIRYLSLPSVKLPSPNFP